MTEAAIAAPDEIRTLLRDWELHLRAKGRRPATIASYLTVGSAFSAYLTANGMPTAVGSISRECRNWCGWIGGTPASMQACRALSGGSAGSSEPGVSVRLESHSVVSARCATTDAGFGLDSLIEIGASIVVLRELSGTGQTDGGARCG